MLHVSLSHCALELSTNFREVSQCLENASTAIFLLILRLHTFNKENTRIENRGLLCSPGTVKLRESSLTALSAARGPSQDRTRGKWRLVPRLLACFHLSCPPPSIITLLLYSGQMQSQKQTPPTHLTGWHADMLSFIGRSRISTGPSCIQCPRARLTDQDIMRRLHMVTHWLMLIAHRLLPWSVVSVSQPRCPAPG